MKKNNNIQKEKFLRIMQRVKPPYYSLLGIDILNVEMGYAKLGMAYDTKLTNPYGYINGGFFSVLADAALACALLGMTDDTSTRRLVSIEFKLNNIRYVKEGSVTAEAKIVHLGKEIAVGEVEIKDKEHNIVAKALITYAVKY